MRIKKTLLGVTALVALAFAAVPALAAAQPKVDAPGEGNFTVAGETALLQAQANVECSASGGSGQFTSKTTGDVELTFTGCKETTFGTQCRTSGQASGTITTTNLTFHTATIEAGANDKGILITPNEGHFASFSCPVVGVNVVVGGSGIVGEITSPAYNTPSATSGLTFGAEGTEQEYKNTESGEYYLEASVNGSEFAEASETAEGTLTFSEGEGILTK